MQEIALHTAFNKEVLRSHEVCAVQFSDDINANQIYYYMKIAV
jgi:hypothetical protein